jgi:hypothetical protein
VNDQKGGLAEFRDFPPGEAPGLKDHVEKS